MYNVHIIFPQLISSTGESRKSGKPRTIQLQYFLETLDLLFHMH